MMNAKQKRVPTVYYPILFIVMLAYLGVLIFGRQLTLLKIMFSGIATAMLIIKSIIEGKSDKKEVLVIVVWVVNFFIAIVS